MEGSVRTEHIIWATYIKNKPLGSKCQRALHQNNTRMCSSEMSSWWANTWNKKMSFALTDIFMKPLMGKSGFSTRFSFNRALRSALHEEMIKMWPEDLRSLTVGADYLSNVTFYNYCCTLLGWNRIQWTTLHIKRKFNNELGHEACRTKTAPNKVRFVPARCFVENWEKKTLKNIEN